MPRFQTVVHENGSASVKLTVPSVMWSLAVELGKTWEVDPEQALKIMMNHIADTLEESNASVLGATYNKAFGRLLAKDKMPLDGVPPIEIGKLHRSARKNSASGFVGVYPNGKNFRAMARSPEGGPQMTVGSFSTAERAAWARYLFYQKHGMVYGEAETQLDSDGSDYWRKALREHFEREPTDLEVLVEVNTARKRSNMEPLPTPEGVELPEPQFA